MNVAAKLSDNASETDAGVRAGVLRPTVIVTVTLLAVEETT
jgi:hypothetical protein